MVVKGAAAGECAREGLPEVVGRGRREGTSGGERAKQGRGGRWIGVPMELSLKEVGRLLNISELTIRDHIASGRLTAVSRGKEVYVTEEGLQAFLLFEAHPSPGPSELSSVLRDALRPLVDRLASLETRIEDREALVEKNQRMSHELRLLDEEVAQKNLEIERLERDLVHQKRLRDQEREDRQKSLDEKWALLQEEATDRIAREREHLDALLAAEQARWEEKIAHIEASHARQIQDMQRREGLWSRLMRMMTWN